ncbi:hypothetical protein COHA_000047 [Chlorella ohadii]|uniref:Uncharacterized protein n=1 Tax=Chlorella ohadii TaxID=2649997 RepID=A0AAD5E1L0_9CHLO|nr:hypothetical protein COHA_000047 [Chlorella ohadii]
MVVSRPETRDEEGIALLARRLADSEAHVHIVPSTSNPAAYGDFGLGLTLTLQMLPYTGVVDADAKNIMYGFALFFGGLSALWAFLAFLLWTCTFGTNLALNLLLLMVTILLALESACPSHPHLYRATGIFGIATAALAFYLGAASLYVEMYGREVLPVFPLNWSKVPLSKRRAGPMATRKELLALAPEFASSGKHTIVPELASNGTHATALAVADEEGLAAKV